MEEERFGRIRIVGPGFMMGSNRVVDYECDCGHKGVARPKILKSGNYFHIGCPLHPTSSFSHGDTGTRLYHEWNLMKQRCYNTNNPSYTDYGGRSIFVCDLWRDSYLAFKTWALSNGYSDSLTLDRLDVNKNYGPDNCQWIPLSEQPLNRRGLLPPFMWKGQPRTLSWLSEHTGMPKRNLRAYRSRGKDIYIKRRLSEMEVD